MKGQFQFLLALVLFFITCGTAIGVDYHIGPGQSYSMIGDVAWESLTPGDRVYIHWRSEPYHEKWVIGVSGTLELPIIVSGVTGPEGQLPVIDGRNATTRRALDYWNENRGLLQIGGSSIPDEEIPSYIIIENLELRSARPPYTFIDDSGNTDSYGMNSASFYVEVGQHLTIRNCIIHDSGNGIFIGVNEGKTKDILIDSNYIHGNGNVGSKYQHNTYTAALGITYQFNRMSGLRAGALGNNLKDRSAGLVVRYNWIENGNRQLDLVDGEDSELVVNHPAYHTTHVYGNILKESDGEGNNQIVHYGGDSGVTARYRKGTLYFFNNTIISGRTGNTTLLRLSSSEETTQVFNNVIYTTADGARLALLNDEGELILRHNWLKEGWQFSHDPLFNGTVIDDGSNIVGDSPGFLNFAAEDYHLSRTSPALDQGMALSSELTEGYNLDQQYVMHQQMEGRSHDGQLDIGAFETVQSPAGDMNGNGKVDLGDVILSLRVLAGFLGEISIPDGSDIGGDNMVTMKEVLFCLRYIAGLPMDT